MIKHLFLVGAGGMLGSMLRYLVFILLKNQTFPFATLAVNITGSFVIGLVAGLALRNASFDNWQLFIATGLCGGFTTFSAFSIECVELFQQQRYSAVIIYIIVSVVIGILAAFCGMMLTK